MLEVLSRIRSMSLRNITLPVRVNHGHLGQKERIDSSSSRIDMLRTSVDVEYPARPTQPRSMKGVWNYGDLYYAFCEGDVRTLSGPLEGVIDEAISLVVRSAALQDIECLRVQVAAERLGLAVGYPRLTRTYNGETPTRSQLPRHARSAGICEFPLVARINHSWCDGNERVEHVDIRQESLVVSFGATFVSRALSSDSLDGLYNYAGLINTISRMQGIEISGPIEELCDVIAAELERDAAAAGVELVQSDVSVRRTGYARCVPTAGLTTTYVQ